MTDEVGSFQVCFHLVAELRDGGFFFIMSVYTHYTAVCYKSGSEIFEDKYLFFF